MKKVKTFLKDSFLGYIAMILLLFVPPFVSGYYLGTADGYFNITLTIILLLVSVLIDVVVWVCFFIVAEEKEDPNKRGTEMKTYKKIIWENEPLKDTPVNESNLLVKKADIMISAIPIEPKKDKLVPLICERCGGSINKETYVCEHCGTQYEWR